MSILPRLAYECGQIFVYFISQRLGGARSTSGMLREVWQGQRTPRGGPT
jgi:hypothetical protein